jgi:hypothetical protein
MFRLNVGGAVVCGKANPRKGDTRTLIPVIAGFFLFSSLAIEVNLATRDLL